MAYHLEAVDLGVWTVTQDGMKPIKNLDKPTKSEEKEIHFNARAKNCLFESFSMDVFNQVFTLNTARSWDDSSSEEEAQHKRSGHKHSSSSTSHVCLMAQLMSMSKNIAYLNKVMILLK